jgi:hypothetical protein
MWPLKNEARYYASCAYHTVSYSDPAVSIPRLPTLPLTKWAQFRDDRQLFQTIKADIAGAQEEAMERDEMISIFDRMCAHGWVAFKKEMLNGLLRDLSRKLGKELNVTGDVVIGIVKPFFKEEGPSKEGLRKQIQTMVLMRSLGWKLRAVEGRNWINGCLVDGADVETRPRYLETLERSWVSAFCCLVRDSEN